VSGDRVTNSLSYHGLGITLFFWGFCASPPIN